MASGSSLTEANIMKAIETLNSAKASEPDYIITRKSMIETIMKAMDQEYNLSPLVRLFNIVSRQIEEQLAMESIL